MKLKKKGHLCACKLFIRSALDGWIVGKIRARIRSWNKGSVKGSGSQVWAWLFPAVSEIIIYSACGNSDLRIPFTENLKWIITSLERMCMLFLSDTRVWIKLYLLFVWHQLLIVLLDSFSFMHVYNLSWILSSQLWKLIFCTFF